MKRYFFLFTLLISVITTRAADVYPTNWWVGMKDPSLQLMIHQKDIGLFNSISISYPGLTSIKITKVENKNYVFVDLVIGKTVKAGKFNIVFSGNGKTLTIPYELRSRDPGNGKTRIKGVNSSDFVYLLMPDRFSNGDPSNDVVANYRDTKLDRGSLVARHGGDLKGVEDHIDYLKQLGVTTVWMTPVVENDMPLQKEQGLEISGYHGYWITDHYNVDKRYGGNEAYKSLINKLHANGMKIVHDAVYNHVGDFHWFVIDPPMKDWLNNWDKPTMTNHRDEALFDPYASSFDKKVMLDGWFVPHLPDINQRNPFVAKFFIQNTIWTTEEFGIDGWRVDTYKYCDEAFMNKLNAAMEKEYPQYTVFGEAYVNSIVGNAYFTRNNISAGFHHNAQGVLDFQACFSMVEAMKDAPSWTGGVNKLYMTLAQDGLYKNPMNNCLFLDNHDMDRIFSTVDEDWKKLRMGLNWLFTLRGFPQLYYGTEVLMKNKKTSTDATVREDFPGGFPGDKEKDNRFTKQGRSDKQDEAFDYISRLANFRKTSSAIIGGNTMQFIPKDGLYVYFRYDKNQTLMVIANSGDKKVKPDWTVFAERVKGFSRVRDVVSGKIQSISDLSLDSKDSFVFELLN